MVEIPDTLMHLWNGGMHLLPIRAAVGFTDLVGLLLNQLLTGGRKTDQNPQL
jgi:hypothetical protein